MEKIEGIKHPEFHSRIKEAIRSSLKILEENPRNIEAATFIDFEYKFDHPFWEVTPIFKVSLNPIIRSYFDDILNLDEVKACIQFVLRNFQNKLGQGFRQATNTEGYKSLTRDEVIRAFLGKYVERIRGFEFNERIFNELYSEVEKYILSNYWETVIVIPLENFELKKADEIVLSDGYRIRKLLKWELTELVKRGYFPKTGTLSEMSTEVGTFRTRYCAEIIIKSEKMGNTGFPPPSSFEKAREFITFLRLFKKGGIKGGPLLCYPKMWRCFWSVNGPVVQEKSPGSGYILSKEESEKFKKFWRENHKFLETKKKRLKSSIRWFEKEYDEDEEMDKLIDYAISLETLYGVGGSGLPLLVSHFLKSKEAGETVEKMVKERGKIVHSGFSQPSQEMIEKIEEITRSSIRKFLELSKRMSSKEVKQKIKESIAISGGNL